MWDEANIMFAHIRDYSSPTVEEKQLELRELTRHLECLDPEKEYEEFGKTMYKISEIEYYLADYPSYICGITDLPF